MKRILCMVLSLLMIASLAACAPKEVVKEKKKTETLDLATLDGEAFYRFGEEKMRALTSARYETKLLEGTKELGEFETVRIRKGYDGFIYSRSGQEEFYSFDGENAYMENEVGAYTAPANIRTYEEYMEEFLFPVCGLNPDLLENFNREENSVTYESSKKELIGLYQFPEKPEFEPLSLTGVAYFDDEGVIVEERITLKGENEECVLKTLLSEYRSDEIEIDEPDSPESFAEVEDIRLPLRLQKAIFDLYEQKEIQTTGTSSNTMTMGEANYTFYDDINTYAKEKEGGYYISHHSLKRKPEVPEESTFYQAILKDGQKQENSYNVILGEKIWENTARTSTLPWKTEVSALMPNLSDFETLSVSENVGGYSVSFVLTEDAAKRVAAKILAQFPDSGVQQPEMKVGFREGTLSVDEKLGIVTSVSYSVEGSFISPTGNGTFAGQYSVFVDGTEGIVLPEMQTPTPTTPGMETEHEH